jgi:hypothetical protein
LASLLNILWRRRLLIVLLTLLGLGLGVVYVLVTQPLYRATATVRPGITGYDQNNNPQREWQLRDVVRWYRLGMYGEDLLKRLGLEPGSYRPDIQAEFIPRGVGIQGGDVITLSTLSPDPGTARGILEHSIAVFNEYAEANSVGNSISLSRKRIGAEIEILSNDRDNIAIKRDLLDLQIARKQQELLGVDIDQEALDLRMREYEVQSRQRLDTAGQLQQGVAVADTGMSQMALYLERMREKEAHQVETDSLVSLMPDLERLPFLWWEMAQDKTAVAGRLLLSTLELENKLREDRLKTIELLSANELDDLRARRDLLRASFDLQTRRATIQSEIREMEINRDRTLDQELTDLASQVRLLSSRLDVLTPLESIGVIMVSDGPVRPRKQRALGLLTLAGLLGSLALAVTWEYLSRNRETILRR